MNNLELPICPKCNDTKYVEKIVGKLNKVFIEKKYRCVQCKLKWERPIFGEIENVG